MSVGIREIALLDRINRKRIWKEETKLREEDPNGEKEASDNCTTYRETSETKDEKQEN